MESDPEQPGAPFYRMKGVNFPSLKRNHSCNFGCDEGSDGADYSFSLAMNPSAQRPYCNRRKYQPLCLAQGHC
jgi:hypothetical protein